MSMDKYEYAERYGEQVWHCNQHRIQVIETCPACEDDKRSSYEVWDINYSMIPAVDLRQEISAALERGESVEAGGFGPLDYNGYLIDRECGVAVFFPAAGRIGVSLGADATWADATSLEQGIDLFCTDPERFEDLN